MRESFSFDSFLDVVANVVGIIIRLILVVWVGARSYDSLAKGGVRLPFPFQPQWIMEALGMADFGTGEKFRVNTTATTTGSAALAPCFLSSRIANRASNSP